jgi:predicted ATPase
VDEPEAAFSPTRQLSLLSMIHDLVLKGSQFIIATHSPILMAYPKAKIYLLTENALEGKLERAGMDWFEAYCAGERARSLCGRAQFRSI